MQTDFFHQAKKVGGGGQNILTRLEIHLFLAFIVILDFLFYNHNSFRHNYYK